MNGTDLSRLFYKQVGENIKKYRMIRNYSLQIVAEKVGLTKKTIQKYENGEIKIDMNRLADISIALGVEVSKLLSGSESFFGIQETNIKMLPIVGKISCGTGKFAYQEIEGYEPTPKEWLNGGEFFYLRAKGDSMTGARINEGDLLLIKIQEDVNNGEIAAVMLNDEAVLKRVYKQGKKIILQSENPNYAPIVCDATGEYHVRIIGKLKYVTMKF